MKHKRDTSGEPLVPNRNPYAVHARRKGHHVHKDQKKEQARKACRGSKRVPTVSDGSLLFC